MTDDTNRADRRKAAADLRREGKLDPAAFLKLAGKFIELANRENQTVPATELHLVFLWAATRYNAHVAKSVLDVPNHEVYVADMTKQFQDMLRQHLADPGLDRPND
ncbi:MAG: DUF3144 domain-containing protein [Hyphomicrobiaceae bacterium]|nr:DUF3144 domain-containing protein [Hyphomicrobiaceae bacterium]